VVRLAAGLAALALAACATGVVDATPTRLPSASSSHAGPSPSASASRSPITDAPGAEDPDPPAASWLGIVTRQVDGDTLWAEVVDGDAAGVEDGIERKLRFLRIDAPELAHFGQPGECLGDEAAAFVAGLTPVGSSVVVAYDEERTDRYDRDLVHIWTSDGTWVNGAVLRAGLAVVVTFPPNRGYDDAVRAAEDDARAARRGLWDPAACAAA